MRKTRQRKEIGFSTIVLAVIAVMILSAFIPGIVWTASTCILALAGILN